MGKLKEISNSEEHIPQIPKKFLKKKTLALYKAFFIKDGEDMQINVDIDVFGLTEEAAVRRAIIYPETRVVSGDVQSAPEMKTVGIVMVTLKTDEFLSEPLTSKCPPFIEDECVSVTLTNRLFELSVSEKHIDELEVEIPNPKNGIRVIKTLVMS